MKKSKIIIISLVVMILIGMIMYFGWKNKTKQEEITEYTPQEEVTQEDLRQTFVSLYFKNKQTGKLEIEARVIDAKRLLKEPYKELVMMLIEGPKNENLERIIPQNTKINKIELKNGVVNLDLSKEFLEGVIGKELEENIIYSIVNTLTELTEVNAVKIQIEGEENKEFLDKEVNFKEEWVRKIEKQ